MPSVQHPLKMEAAALSAFLKQAFPQFHGEILSVTESASRVRHQVSAEHLRPGGTVSGPTLMALADVALYIDLLSKIGPVPLAVTTDFTCHFLNKPAAHTAIEAEARLLKLGRRLAIGEVYLYSEGVDNPVAHVVATYSIPPQEKV
ncbi:PaaI family thioesterase [Marinospirillum sp.]|uniref:PaaI family thioesterase n=1 Tax=Marinospirillum sp. TaxID=2183934 RepID=UPI003A8A21FA